LLAVSRFDKATADKPHGSAKAGLFGSLVHANTGRFVSLATFCEKIRRFLGTGQKGRCATAWHGCAGEVRQGVTGWLLFARVAAHGKRPENFLTTFHH
jgi:hypothetical protein